MNLSFDDKLIIATHIRIYAKLGRSPDTDHRIIGVNWVTDKVMFITQPEQITMESSFKLISEGNAPLLWKSGSAK